MDTRCTTTLILLLLIASPAVGQTTEQLSPSQLQHYNENSFRIELPGIQVVSTSGEAMTLGYSRAWRAYRGYNSVSEPDFFELVEQRTLARQAKRARRNKYFAIGLGGLSVIAGTVLMASGNGFNEDGGLRFSMGPKILGVSLIAAGGGTIGFAALRMQHRRAPYWVAEEVAREYNAKLLQEMQEQR